MKRLITYCLCAVTMALCLSCSSNDEEVAPEKSYNKLIVGSWYEYIFETYINGELDDIVYFDDNEMSIRGYVETYFSDGTGRWREYNLEDNVDVNDFFSWEIIGTSLVTKVKDGDEYYVSKGDIIELTNEKLIISYTFINYNGDTEKEVSYFKRYKD